MATNSYTNGQPQEMSKKEAEEILGFSPSQSYTHAEMTERYHNTITNKVTAGASAEEMGKVDRAKAFLDSYFVEDPAATLVSETASKTSGDSGGSVIGIGLGAFSTAMGSMESDTSALGPASLSAIYVSAHKDAALALGYPYDAPYDVPELDGDYPLWYQVVSKMVLRFPWRLVFLLIVAAWGFPAIWGNSIDGDMFEMAGQGLGMIIETILLIALIAVNTIFGVFTNLIRKGLRALANWGLQTQVALIVKHSLKRQIAEGAAGSVETGTAATGQGNRQERSRT